MAEAKLQKLKVTELKDLLSKHGLVQSGKKEELVKRLVDAGVDPDASEELVEPETEPIAAPVAAAPAPAEPAPAAAAPVAAAAPAPATEPSTTTTTAAAEPEAAAAAAEPAEEELTEEEKKQKARAERFGIPWVRTQPKPAAAAAKSAPKASKPSESAPAPAAAKEEKKKASAIDGTPLGISPEVLARRAAKFGIPPKSTTTTAAAEPETKSDEVDPQVAADLAAEAQKKRKRAEKFGTATNPPPNGAESDAKKAKV